MKQGLVRIGLLALLVSACGGGAELSDEAEIGSVLVGSLGCVSCHGASNGVGPSWDGVWGTVRTLSDGSTVVFDAEYVRASISKPEEQIVKGFDPVMPAFSLSDADLDSIVAFLEESS
jgi:cytochrome c oxidase subunit 2